MILSSRRALALLLLATAVAGAPDAEAKLQKKVAKVWVDYARWCKVQGVKEEATRALAEAEAADPEAKDVGRLKQEVDALPDGGTNAGLERRRKKAHKDAAKLYDKLARLDHAPEDAARFEGFLFKAAALDPSKTRLSKITARIKKLASNRKTTGEAGRLLVRLKEIAPEGKYAGLEAELARKDALLIKSPDHEMVGYLSLPGGWRKGRRYPVLVAVDGAGSGFLGRARNFAKTRGGRGFIVLAPCSLSNTNQLEAKKYPFYAPEKLEEWNRDRIVFDTAGLNALLALVAERFGGEEKFAITGFSGGGNLCYAMTVRHPERILFSAPACANFTGMGFREAKKNPADGGPPIRIFTGEQDPHRDYTFGKKDQPGIEPQTDRAVQVLKEFGYTNLERTMLKGVKHSPCAQQVWEVADQLGK